MQYQNRLVVAATICTLKNYALEGTFLLPDEIHLLLAVALYNFHFVSNKNFDLSSLNSA
jgi:hypothetical protein